MRLSLSIGGTTPFSFIRLDIGPRPSTCRLRKKNERCALRTTVNLERICTKKGNLKRTQVRETLPP